MAIYSNILLACLLSFSFPIIITKVRLCHSSFWKASTSSWTVMITSYGVSSLGIPSRTHTLMRMQFTTQNHIFTYKNDTMNLAFRETTDQINQFGLDIMKLALVCLFYNTCANKYLFTLSKVSTQLLIWTALKCIFAKSQKICQLL